MTKPLTRVHNTETGEIIDREMTDDEYAEYQKGVAETQGQQDIIEAAQKAKDAAQAKLAALGLTGDDLKALGL